MTNKMIITFMTLMLLITFPFARQVSAEQVSTIQQTQVQDAKKMHRSNTDKMIGGVAGGVAEYFGIDSVFVRIAFAVLVLCFGTGILLYLACWIIVPSA